MELDDAFDVEFVTLGNPPCDRTYALESELAIASQTIAELVARNMELHSQIELLRIEVQQEREHCARVAPTTKKKKPVVARVKARQSARFSSRTAGRTAGHTAGHTECRTTGPE